MDFLNLTNYFTLGSKDANAIAAALVVMVSSHIFLPDVANLFTQLYAGILPGSKNWEWTVFGGGTLELVLRAAGLIAWVAGLYTLSVIVS